METVRFSKSMRARAPETGCRREDERPAVAAVERLERPSVDGGALVNVAPNDQLCSCARERAQGVVPLLERELARGPPGSAREMMVEDNGAKSVRRRVAQRRLCGGEPGWGEPSALMPPRTRRVETADDGIGRAEHGIRCPENLVEPIPRTRESRREGVGEVVVPRHDERWGRQSVEERLCCLELRCPAAVREVAARDYGLGRDLLAQFDERIVERRGLARAAVEVGDVDKTCSHRRTRLYTRSVSEQTPEIFDDLYLGLQAGGALRKQRRGEELTEQEEAALGHWQRLSVWRKVVAVGAFALGTFGLGFTLGGLIFGHRKG